MTYFIMALPEIDARYCAAKAWTIVSKLGSVNHVRGDNGQFELRLRAGNGLLPKAPYCALRDLLPKHRKGRSIVDLAGRNRQRLVE
jgi:hypothetical protein